MRGAVLWGDDSGLDFPTRFSCVFSEPPCIRLRCLLPRTTQAQPLPPLVYRLGKAAARAINGQGWSQSCRMAAAGSGGRD